MCTTRKLLDQFSCFLLTLLQEWSEELHAISKKSVKGTLGGSGGDNVAISSYRSTSEFSNHDYNDPTFSSLVER